MSGHEISADERGDTTGPRRKLVAFAAIVAAVAGGVVAIAAGNDVSSGSDDTQPRSPVAGVARSVVAKEPAAGDIAQAELVDTEDARLFRAVSRGTTRRNGVTTIVLDQRDTGTYGPDDLVALGAATRKGRIVTLHRPVVIRTGAALAIRLPGGTLRLAGTAAGPVSIVAWGGSLTLSGSADKPLTVVGWDRVAKAPDTDVSNGRGYVRAHSGRLAVKHATFQHLGFWSGRSGGLAATGTSFDPGRAQISDTTITDTHIGVYLVGTRNARISRTRISGADRDGVEVDRSRGTRLADVTVAGSGVNGIRVHDHSTRMRITGGSTTGNAGLGVAVDGRPQADGPNASGYNVVNASGLDVTGTSLGNNSKGGILVTGTSTVTLSDLTIDEAFRPVRIVGRSTATELRDSVLTTGRGPVVEISDGAREVAVRGNTLTGTTVGVEVVGAQVDVAANTMNLRHGTAVSVTGAGSSGTIGDNVVSGSGNRAFDVPTSAAVVIDENDTTRWETTHASVEWVQHNPFALLWLAILLIPAIGVNFIVRRFRMHRDLRRLTEETVIAMAKARRRGGTAPPIAPAPPPAPAAPAAATALLARPGTVPDVEPIEVTRTDRLVSRGAMGQFASAEDLAVHAVLEGGKSPERVARTLQVPVAMVEEWVRNSRADDR
ncbi:MAG: right-handed parallel beta-helix repeat-containing protein [Aeromicrobium sp.]